MSAAEKVPLAPGQVWHDRRPGFEWRTVEITGLRREDWGGGAYVKRNTSRRRQAISEKTLRRHYKLRTDR